MKTKFYHLTDLHYYSKQNFEIDPRLTPKVNDFLALAVSEEIVRSAFEQIKNDDEVDTVIITGDLTNHGDLPSCKELAQLLKDLSQTKTVITSYASHDYMKNKTYKIDKDGKKVPKDDCRSDEELNEFFDEFGFDFAIAKHEASHSFVNQISPKVRCISIYPNLHGGHTITDEFMEFAKNEAKKAKEDDNFIFANVHYPIISPSPMYTLMSAASNFISEGERLIDEFAKMGITLLINGHTHIHDVSYKLAENGEYFYAVTTSALTGYPPCMRKITIDDDTMQVQLETIDVQSTEQMKIETSLRQYTKDGFLGFLDVILQSMENDVEYFASGQGGFKVPKDLIMSHQKATANVGKFINNLTFGKIAKFVKKEAELTKDEFEQIKDKKVAPFIIDLIAKLYDGRQDISPDTPEFKVTMSTVAVIDSVIKFLPIDISKLIKQKSLSDLMVKLLYNNSINNENTILKLGTQEPETKSVKTYSSKKGGKIIVAVATGVVVLLPLEITIGTYYAGKTVFKRIKKKIKKSKN